MRACSCFEGVRLRESSICACLVKVVPSAMVLEEVSLDVQSVRLAMLSWACAIKVVVMWEYGTSNGSNKTIRLSSMIATFALVGIKLEVVLVEPLDMGVLVVLLVFDMLFSSSHFFL